MPRPTLVAAALTLAVAVAVAGPSAPVSAQQPGKVHFTDLMQVRQIEDEVLSDDGRWLAFTAAPDRGDPELVVRSTDGRARHAVALGSDPVFSADGAWVAATLNPSLEARETAEEGETPHPGLVLVETATGRTREWEDVRAFAFSADGDWLAYHRFPPEEEEEADEGAAGEGEAGDGKDPADDDGPRPGTLVLHRLSDHSETAVEGVRRFAFAEAGPWIAWTVGGPDADGDGLYVTRAGDADPAPVAGLPDGSVSALTWEPERERLAFVVRDGEAGAPGSLWTWDGQARLRVAAAEVPEGWTIPADQELEWSDDGERLFFGWRALRPGEAEEEPGDHMRDEDDDGRFDPYDVEAILEDRGVDVWHWEDPRIKPQQKVMWEREEDLAWLAVHHLDGGRTVRLGGPDLPEIEPPSNDRVALAVTDVPYRREFTWAGGQQDVWVVDLDDGSRTRVAERVRNGASLSPGGRYVAWWADGAWHLFDREGGQRRTLTEGLGVPFADELHDYPDPAPGYGVAGWIEGDRAVLLYDRYDIWVVPTGGGEAWSLTAGEGREARRVFRVVDTDDEPDDAFGEDEELLLSSYHDVRKNHGFYSTRTDRPGVTRLLEEDKRFRFRERADDAPVLLYSREDYDEFPDLWVAGPDFDDPRKVTDANPGLFERFAWGDAELVEWRSLDGEPLQGVVIKPEGYVEGRRYPVLVYYYRYFSQRLHEFNDPSVNHRPSFPVYASDGYVVFLPDVRFEVGRPGLASTKSVVPGVQELVDRGIADPDAIALHGHSWSGYQTAFMITQTDIFTTAVAGAPVSNMTSAYSGIRLGSGLARQFQYEMGQSRIGGSLWEARDAYIDNSPVFFADRIDTPLLILHGDVDDAVPWEQSIELYLALRRLDKEVVLLQYRDEPHHPQTYANKLDWAIRMKQWIDHYLKGEPAPDWMTVGAPYTGN